MNIKHRAWDYKILHLFDDTWNRAFSRGQDFEGNGVQVPSDVIDFWPETITLLDVRRHQTNQ